MTSYENPSAMEPLLPEENRYPLLADLAIDLTAKANMLAARLNPIVAKSIGDLVRSMNCYYSNLIEGHNTHPRDIDKALAENFSKDPIKRALQLEAKAHIEVQRMIDYDEVAFSISSDFIKWIHYEFCKRLPDEYLWVENPDTQKKSPVIPGEFRSEWVQVGRHIPPAPEYLKKFLDRFAEAYHLKKLSKTQQIIAAAASHHRLLWIHPFLDGNGRVARLFSHSFLRHINIGSSLWSISRGLARQSSEYKQHLMNADSVRQGDLDGRGNLSAKALEQFCEFFLKVCLDQINYMDDLIEPSKLSNRIKYYIDEEQDQGRLPRGTFPLLREALLTGEVERGKVQAITGYKERQARTIVTSLLQAKLLVSDSPKGPVRINFPIDVVERWFPKLYPAL